MPETNSAATIDRINSALARLGTDELAVVNCICERLILGRANYGELRLDGDKRDWMVELEQELMDGVVYGAIQIVKRRRGIL